MKKMNPFTNLPVVIFYDEQLLDSTKFHCAWIVCWVQRVICLLDFHSSSKISCSVHSCFQLEYEIPIYRYNWVWSEYPNQSNLHINWGNMSLGMLCSVVQKWVELQKKWYLSKPPQLILTCLFCMETTQYRSLPCKLKSSLFIQKWHRGLTMY